MIGMDIELPEYCEKCPFVFDSCGECSVVNKKIEDYDFWNGHNERPDWCPLHPFDLYTWIKEGLIKKYEEEKYCAAMMMVDDGLWTQSEASNWLATGYTYIKSYGVREVKE